MATKDTLYKFYAHVTLESGKTRHLFTNDTVARTKVLQKNGINMDAVKWIAIEPAKTKADFFLQQQEGTEQIQAMVEPAKEEAVA